MRQGLPYSGRNSAMYVVVPKIGRGTRQSVSAQSSPRKHPVEAGNFPALIGASFYALIPGTGQHAGNDPQRFPRYLASSPVQARQDHAITGFGDQQQLVISCKTGTPSSTCSEDTAGF
ncbi:MAG TPA: hypothetical protein VGC19_05990 [Rhodanobacter sp.]